MRFLILFNFLVFIFACNSKKVTTNSKAIINNSICPKDGVCTFNIEKDKMFTLKKDDIGALYPVIGEGEKTILKFEYKQNEIPNVQDNSYKEIILLEIDLKNPEISLTNSTLKTAKATFARLCFCRGKTGYYPIKEGKLNITKIDDKTYSLEFDFKIEEVPQIINKIKETIKL